MLPKKILIHAIFNILVKHAGASEDLRESFLYNWGTSEFRFCGKLGPGGKFWNDGGGFRVDCYKEDETPERLAIMEKVNKLLLELPNMS